MFKTIRVREDTHHKLRKIMVAKKLRSIDDAISYMIEIQKATLFKEV